MGLAIGPMGLDDYDDMMALWRESEGVGLSGADSRDGVAAFLAHNPGLSLVARDEGRLVGAVLCGHDGRRGYLHHLAVAPEYRRRGIGRALVDGCLARLAAIGIEKCHIWVYAANGDGAAFWSAIGWGPRDDLRIMSRATAP